MQRFATPAPVDHVSLMRSRIRVSAVASMNQSALNVAFAPAGTMMFVVMSLAKPTALKFTNPACPAMSVQEPDAVAPVKHLNVIVALILIHPVIVFLDCSLQVEDVILEILFGAEHEVLQ